MKKKQAASIAIAMQRGTATATTTARGASSPCTIGNVEEFTGNGAAVVVKGAIVVSPVVLVDAVVGADTEMNRKIVSWPPVAVYVPMMEIGGREVILE